MPNGGFGVGRLNRDRDSDPGVNPITGEKVDFDADGLGKTINRQESPFLRKEDGVVLVLMQCMEHPNVKYEMQVLGHHIRQSEEEMEQLIVSDLMMNRSTSHYMCGICKQTYERDPEAVKNNELPRVFRRPKEKLHDRDTV